MTKKKPEHYVNNKELLDALILHRNKVALAKENNLPKPKISNYLGECFLKIATHLSYKPNFVNYMFREDMISDGVENCLHRSTIIPTIEYGPIEIEKLVNKEATVRCIDGKWRKAQGKSYGTQILYEYGFSSFDDSTQDATQKVIATQNHRWFVSPRRNKKIGLDYENQLVTDLTIGDCLQNAPIENEYDRQSILHGLLYGDRSECNSLVNEDSGFNIGNYSLVNDLPSTTDPKYIAGFIHGWWLADRNKTLSPKTLQINTTSNTATEWLLNYAAYAGYHIIGHERKQNDESIDNEKTLNVITLGKPEEYQPKVSYIIEYGKDEVFCLEEKETNSFVLGNGILTGNCIQYIHNFDPQKSTNPFAYFTQIIHYAFLRRIQKEKKQLEVKTKLIEKTGYDEVMVVDDSLLFGNSSDYNSIKDAIQYRGNR